MRRSNRLLGEGCLAGSDQRCLASGFSVDKERRWAPDGPDARPARRIERRILNGTHAIIRTLTFKPNLQGSQ